MSMSLLVLGIGSAVPTVKRNPSAQLLDIRGSLYLIDCGEGTQIQLRAGNVRMQKINHIFISHMHGDHYLGLIGLIWTMNLLGRKTGLTVIGPPEIREIINLHLASASGKLDFKLNFVSTMVPAGTVVHEDSKVTVTVIELKHKIRTTGFLFREKEKPRKLIKAKLEQYDIPVGRRKAIKEGKDFFDQDSDRWIPNAELTTPSTAPASFAYCSDTAYNEKTAEQVKEVDLLYHESTFLEPDKGRAKKTRHSTAAEAAMIAKKAKVKQLMLGHYSNRYKELDLFLDEACAIFENTVLGEEGKTYEITNA